MTEQAEPWRLPWPVTSGLAAVITAALGWVLVAGYCVLGWISVPQLKASAVLALSTQGWLLAHGVSVSLPGAQLSIMPLGLTLVIVLIGLAACHQAVLHSRPPLAGEIGSRLLRMSGVFAVVYVVVLAGGRQFVEAGGSASTLLGAMALSCLLPLAGFTRALAWRPPRGMTIVRTVGWSLAAGLLVMIAAGSAVTATALIRGRSQVIMIHESLLPGTLGGVMLLLGQLAWLPNLILWAGAWSVGAGIQLGLGTVVSPAQTTLGMLPSIPVLGAVPAAGPMPPSCLLWLLSGVVAGGAAAAVLVKRLQTRAAANGRQLGVDVTAIVGALAGVGCGLVFTLLQLPAGGDLGSVRLTSLGARMSALLVMAPSTMGLAGMATGAVLGWRAGRSDWQSVRSAEAPVPSLNPADGPVPAVATTGEAADEAEVPTTVVEDRSKLAERDR